MKKRNGWNTFGIILGVLLILVGFVFMLTPPDSYSTDSADIASFGADYYTYQYEATRIAARNTAVTANNLREIGETMSLYFGTAFMFAGALVVVSYGKKASEHKAQWLEAKRLAAAEAAAAAAEEAAE